MIFAVALVGAVCLGLGWVLQQRVAAQQPDDELSVSLMRHLMSQRVWWLGIATMSAGAALGGLALQFGSITLVEPLLSANLLFAFVFAAILGRASVKSAEVIGAVLLSASLGVFIAAGKPQAAAHGRIPSVFTGALVMGVVVAVVIVLVGSARRRSAHVEAALLATAAGIMYGLQDMATRTTIVAFDNRGVVAAIGTPWPYVVVCAAAIGISLAQSAFRTARLDYSLPPASAAEPIVGIALGISVLGDRLTATPGAVTVELLCLLAMIGGVTLIARADSLTQGFAYLHHH
jgi:hypothetical protein